MTLSTRDFHLCFITSAIVCLRFPLTTNSAELTLPKESLVGELVTAFPSGKVLNLGNAVETLAVHWLLSGQVAWSGQSAVTREVSQTVWSPCRIDPLALMEMFSMSVQYYTSC